MIVTVDVGLACGFWRYLATPTIVKTLQIRFLRDSQVRGITNIIGIYHVLQRIKFIFLISRFMSLSSQWQGQAKIETKHTFIFLFFYRVLMTQQLNHSSNLLIFLISFPLLLHFLLCYTLTKHVNKILVVNTEFLMPAWTFFNVPLDYGNCLWKERGGGGRKWGIKYKRNLNVEGSSEFYMH